MAFPDAERVLYQQNPLDEVICQLRFPPVLRIETEPPALFQEQVRADYPFYTEKPGVKIPPGFPAEVADLFHSQVAGGGRKSHLFESADRQWALTLHRDSLTLTCRDYMRWEDFRAHLVGAYEALLASYGVPFFTRIGLHYRDVIRRSLLDLDDVPWGELLQPWISGVLGSSAVAEAVGDTQSVCLIRLPDDIGQVRVNFGLASAQWESDDGRPVQEPIFIIDADHFIDEQTEIFDVNPRLAALNRQSGLLFRWCITERLHEALRPGPVPGVRDV